MSGYAEAQAGISVATVSCSLGVTDVARLATYVLLVVRHAAPPAFPLACTCDALHLPHRRACQPPSLNPLPSPSPKPRTSLHLVPPPLPNRKPTLTARACSHSVPLPMSPAATKLKRPAGQGDSNPGRAKRNERPESDKETYLCPFPGCGQVYSRREYLRRHHRKRESY